MKLFVRAIVCSLLFIFLSTAAMAQQKQPVVAQTSSPTNYSFKIFPAANGTYGYDIYADGKLRIHQPAIPAMPGNDGFKTKAAAEKVAGLAISKMKKGESLPTISPDELKKLKAI